LSANHFHQSKTEKYIGNLIGLTIIAVGTSLTELATSAMAAYRGNADIAFDNIVGLNISSIFYTWGHIDHSPHSIQRIQQDGIGLAINCINLINLLDVYRKKRSLGSDGGMDILSIIIFKKFSVRRST
jgi:cation:H+ antiporter